MGIFLGFKILDEKTGKKLSFLLITALQPELPKIFNHPNQKDRTMFLKKLLALVVISCAATAVFAPTRRKGIPESEQSGLYHIPVDCSGFEKDLSSTGLPSQIAGFNVTYPKCKNCGTYKDKHGCGLVFRTPTKKL